MVCPRYSWMPAVTTVLQRALRTGRLKRGFDTTLEVLANERHGLEHLRHKTGTEQKARVSRLILISSDASERLLREIALTLLRNAPRVLALALQADSATLGSLPFGPNTIVKVLLLDHKDTVAEMLIAAAQQKRKKCGVRCREFGVVGATPCGCPMGNKGTTFRLYFSLFGSKEKYQKKSRPQLGPD